MEQLFLALSIASIAVMFYAFIRVNMLRRQIPGGIVRSTWNILAVLITLFTVGYLSTPFFPMIPDVYKQIIVGVIFLAGAVFVVIVINLFFRIAKEIGL